MNRQTYDHKLHEAVHGILHAYNTPGTRPDVHARQKERLRQEWTPLWAAIVNLSQLPTVPPLPDDTLPTATDLGHRLAQLAAPVQYVRDGSILLDSDDFADFARELLRERMIGPPAAAEDPDYYDCPDTDGGTVVDELLPAPNYPWAVSPESYGWATPAGEYRTLFTTDGDRAKLEINSPGDGPNIHVTFSPDELLQFGTSALAALAALRGWTPAELNAAS